MLVEFKKLQYYKVIFLYHRKWVTLPGMVSMVGAMCTSIATKQSAYSIKKNSKVTEVTVNKYVQSMTKSILFVKPFSC